MICYIIVASVAPVLSGLTRSVRLIAVALGALLRATGQECSGSMPKDTRTILNSLSFAPVTRAFVSCPKVLQALSPPRERQERTKVGREVPSNCTYKSTPNCEPCKRSLTKTRMVKGVEVVIFARLFFYQNFKDWFAKFISRPGIEDLVDQRRACGRLFGCPERYLGRFGSAQLQRQGRQPIHSQRWKQGPPIARYVFAFCWDGFNPLGSREAGKKVSSCAM